MKIRNPQSRRDLSIRKQDRVVDVGPGNFPHPRANVIVDKFDSNNYHRSGDVRILKHQEFICADGENLPFADKAFDYSICCHVLEHVDDPLKFVSEQARVAGRGYLETPSLLGEYLMPKESHKWVLMEIGEKVVMYEKEKIDFFTCPDMGYVFLEYLPKTSVAYKMLQRTHINLTNVSYEWSRDIEVLVNPDSSYYREFFTRPPGPEYCREMFPSRSLGKEAMTALWALGDVFISAVKSKVLKING